MGGRGRDRWVSGMFLTKVRGSIPCGPTCVCVSVCAHCECVGGGEENILRVIVGSFRIWTIMNVEGNSFWEG